MPHYGTPFTREVQRRAGRARGRFNTEKPRLEKNETTERAMELRRRFTSRRRVV